MNKASTQGWKINRGVKDSLSYETASKWLRYDAETGGIFWRKRPAHQVPVGTRAGCSLPTGHVRIRFRGESFAAHRLAWLLHYGEWPEGLIDHVNQDPADNRIINLRDVDHIENGRNQRMASDNTSGTSGVRWHPRDRVWYASIGAGGTKKHLGVFKNKEDAIRRRKLAEKELGYAPRHGMTPSKAAQREGL